MQSPEYSNPFTSNATANSMMNSCKPGFQVCFASSVCRDGKTSTAACWIYILVLIIILAFFLIQLRRKINKARKGDFSEIAKAAVSTDVKRLKNMLKRHESIHFSNQSIVEKKITARNISQLVVEPLDRTLRSEENFIKGNRDLDIKFPSDYPPEYEPMNYVSLTSFLRTIGFIMTRDLYTSIAVHKCAVLAMCVPPLLLHLLQCCTNMSIICKKLVRMVLTLTRVKIMLCISRVGSWVNKVLTMLLLPPINSCPSFCFWHILPFWFRGILW